MRSGQSSKIWQARECTISRCRVGFYESLLRYFTGKWFGIGICHGILHWMKLAKFFRNWPRLKRLSWSIKGNSDLGDVSSASGWRCYKLIWWIVWPLQHCAVLEGCDFLFWFAAPSEFFAGSNVKFRFNLHLPSAEGLRMLSSGEILPKFILLDLNIPKCLTAIVWHGLGSFHICRLQRQFTFIQQHFCISL